MAINPFDYLTAQDMHTYRDSLGAAASPLPRSPAFMHHSERAVAHRGTTIKSSDDDLKARTRAVSATQLAMKQADAKAVDTQDIDLKKFFKISVVNSNKQEFVYCHEMMLTRFKILEQAESVKLMNGNTLTLEGSKEAVERFLDYVYLQRFLKQPDPKQYNDLYFLAKQFNIEGLRELCQKLPGFGKS